MPLLPTGAFARGVLALGSGTALAQAIPVLASPLLTRLYDPAQMGMLALYLSVLAVLVVVGTGRLELAIPLARRTGEARVLLRVCLVLAAAGSGALALLLAAGTWAAAAWPGDRPAPPTWLWMLPLGMLFASAGQSLGYWSNRRALYRRMAAARVAQSSATCGGQLALGAWAAGAAGLIGASVLGQALQATLLWRHARREPAYRRRLPRRAWRAVLRRHRRFPAYMIPGQLANVASAHAPVLMLATLFDPALAGLYALAERVLLMPAAVIGSAVGDVYRQHAAAEFHARGECRALFTATARRLALLALAPMLVVLLAGAPLFAIVFGEFWRPAGELATILAPMAFFQFVASPLSQTVLLGGLHRLDMLWQFARLALAAGAMLAGWWAGADARLAVGLYAGAFCLLYGIHLVLQYRVATGALSRPLGPVRDRGSGT